MPYVGLNPLSEIVQNASDDLREHFPAFDAIVSAGDMHGVAIAAGIAARLNKPLMIVCTKNHKCCVSHIVMIGEITPDMRFLYVDDMFAFGASKRHVFDYAKRAAKRRGRVFRYMTQSEPCTIVATYEAMTRTYAKVNASETPARP
jgi:orotate phosphoribosyltransferase